MSAPQRDLVDVSQPGRESIRWWWITSVVSLALATGSLLWSWNQYSNLSLLESELAVAEAELHREQVVLAEAARYANAMERRVALMLAAKPFLPIRMQLPVGLLDSKNTLVFQNMRVVPLSVVARFRDPVRGRETTLILEFGPMEALEVGPAQGWAFSSGHEITMVNEYYAIKRLTVP